MRSLFGTIFLPFARYIYDGIRINYGNTLIGAVAAVLVPSPFILFFLGVLEVHFHLDQVLNRTRNMRRELWRIRVTGTQQKRADSNSFLDISQRFLSN